MKKLYTLSIALSMVAFGTQSFAQVNKTVKFAPEYPDAERTVATDNQVVKGNLDTKSTDAIVFWSEDFSNGFDGQGDNGAWNFDLDNGELWFQTFPADQPNGYDPDAPLVGQPAYQDALSSFYGGAEVNSPTRDNGFMMIDATRWDNSGGAEIISALVSPSIDLSGQGITNANLVFYQRLRMCCAGSGLVANAEVSVDGGVTWVPYDVFYPYGSTNDNINQEIRIDISETLQGAITLDNVKVRFLWAGAQTNYFWQIDDVSIQELEDNDLQAGATWYNNHSTGYTDYNEGLLNGEEYLRTFENSRTPIYFARPLTFGMVVTNNGFETQTGVQVVVTGIKPDGSTFPIGATESINMPYGMTDTINLEPTSIPDLETGLYRFAYTVIQNEADSRPMDNVGDTTATRFTDESSAFDYFSIMQNTRNVNGGRYPFADNIIWSTAYSFPEVAEGVGPKAITHVEAVFMFTGPTFAPTVVGTTVYFNVRKGSLIDEDPDVPESLTTVEFGNDPLNYEGIDIEFTITEDDIWYTADGIAAYHYASFELPTPVLIEPNTAYQAEVRIPFGNAVYVPVSSPEEELGSLVYLFNYNANAPGWYGLGDAVMPLRFRVADPVTINVDEITYETGISLVQNYPNPFTDVTRIQYSIDKADNVKLEVRDISGKLVFEKDMGTVPAGMPQSYELQRGNLAPGMYTYSIVTSEYQVSRKLTVQ